MKYAIFILHLGFAALVLSAGQSSARNVCMGSASTWDDCYRSVTDADGNKYVGTFKKGKFEGEGKYSEANGNVYTALQTVQNIPAHIAMALNMARGPMFRLRVLLISAILKTENMTGAGF